MFHSRARRVIFTVDSTFHDCSRNRSPSTRRLAPRTTRYVVSASSRVKSRFFCVPGTISVPRHSPPPVARAPTNVRERTRDRRARDMTAAVASSMDVDASASTGLRAYYDAKIEALGVALRDKTQNLRRLEAQRNELNGRGAQERCDR